MKRTPKEAKKAFTQYYESLSADELSDSIKTTQQRLKIMLLIAKNKRLI